MTKPVKIKVIQTYDGYAAEVVGRPGFITLAPTKEGAISAALHKTLS